MSVVTVINEENKMIIDGDVVEFDLGLDDNVWAIQWDGSKGHIEYNDGTPNKDITEFPELESLTAKHTQAKIQAKIDAEAKVVADEKKRVDAMTYKEKRKMEYDRLEQFEMQYDDKINNTTTWVDAIKAIKATYPK
jgi:hypothetical protein